MKRVASVSCIVALLLLGGWQTGTAQVLGQCLDLTALGRLLRQYNLEMREDGGVVHTRTGRQFTPTCQGSGPSVARACINCANAEEVAKGMGRCVWFLEGETCALSIPFIGIDIAWTISETFACVGSLGTETPGAPLAVSEILTILEVNGYSCADRAVSADTSGIAFVELSAPNARVCGRHAVAAQRLGECARGTP